ncbi:MULTISPECIES: hypothetical protein [unclassified Ruegeria]|uniref:hypothetical protein n=1 Tax=unclassified Ruegeria TaxID=2625375 RepID=UPI001489B033|nr:MULTISPECIES: hypothetical protein [unclassified Ruegeria]NOD35090.1 hypothetical protein [Ruegeria sp. HKCCD7296]NOD46944.1 hypothetical protein [Ruegeria sp. HKCCD5849]NOD51267.1 hypothetical protein [Ruegeria sp. HKCCD5851]NOD68086.1 hypothetical protein [Ruegeria sp. HKCCD7303]NOE33490.1 hypothetical protein [Ruegeria sp. HKCCD7318]
MTATNLYSEAEQLEQKLEGACLDTRLALQPSVSKVVDRMRQQGMHVPSRLRRLDAALCEDAMEAQFDNLPI